MFMQWENPTQEGFQSLKMIFRKVLCESSYLVWMEPNQNVFLVRFWLVLHNESTSYSWSTFCQSLVALHKARLVMLTHQHSCPRSASVPATPTDSYSNSCIQTQSHSWFHEPSLPCHTVWTGSGSSLSRTCLCLVHSSLWCFIWHAELTAPLCFSRGPVKYM